MLLAIKQNTDQNALPIAEIIGSFHVILDLFISTRNAMKYFTNKTVSMKFHWKSYVMSSDDYRLWSFI